jgi:hypothetical protein
LQQSLRDAGVGDEPINALVDFSEKGDAYRFSGGSLEAASKADILNKAEALISLLNSAAKKVKNA